MNRPTDTATTPTDPTNDYRVQPPPPCEGCGGAAHGGVNAGLHCLRIALLSARAMVPLERRPRWWARWTR